MKIRILLSLVMLLGMSPHTYAAPDSAAGDTTNNSAQSQAGNKPATESASPKTKSESSPNQAKPANTPASTSTAGSPADNSGFSDETRAAINKLISDSFSDTKDAVEKLQAIGDPKVLPILQAMKDETLRKTKDGQIVILNEEMTQGRNVFTGKVIKFSEDAVSDLQQPKIRNNIRVAITNALSTMELFSQDLNKRLKATTVIANKKEVQTGLEKPVRNALAKEKNQEVITQLKFILARIDVKGPNQSERLAAIKILADGLNANAKNALQDVLKKHKEGKLKGQYLEKDQKIIQAAETALAQLNRREFMYDQVNNLWFGIGQGSLYLLAAIGLAITFGIMGVINMAHGATLMVGAFTTFTIQAVFTYTVGESTVISPWYLLFAIPSAFLVSGLFGIGMERTVVKHLYNRPLDTLLATFGIGLILVVTFKVSFGSDFKAVVNPEFIRGSTTLFGNIVIQYNWLAIILFAAFVVLVVWYILRRTPLGLQVRAVTQNRTMASAMGISTSNVDRLTFGLGSGIAGLGGVALAQAGFPIGPELGTVILIDCFMVVVLGGVGNLAGTIIGAMLIGIVSKFLEPWVGVELSKVIMLTLVIIFIQIRPQGMFALKGRAAEA